MAIEIIPKKNIRFPLWLNILFYVSLFLLILCLISFFALNHVLKNSAQELEQLEESLIKERTFQRVELEGTLLAHQKRINDFSSLTEKHYLPSNFFGFLERICHPRSYFTEAAINSRESSVVLSGFTDSFSTLGQQVFILEEEDLVKNIKLSKISINKEGGVGFDLELSFNPGLFKDL